MRDLRPVSLSPLSQCAEGKRGAVSTCPCLSAFRTGPPSSQGPLLGGEEPAFLLLPPPQSVDPPAHGRHDQHHEAGAQQGHRDHFGLEQRVELKGHPGPGHADDQRYDAEREHAAVPGLLRAPRSLRQSLQGWMGLGMHGRVPPGGVPDFSVQAPVLGLRVRGRAVVGLCAVAAFRIWVEDRGRGLAARGAAHLRVG